MHSALALHFFPASFVTFAIVLSWRGIPGSHVNEPATFY